MLTIMRVHGERSPTVGPRAATVAALLRAAIGGLALSSVFFGCARVPQARRIIAPDGAPAFHVSCGADQGACFQLAGESCPNGYRLKPIFDPESNNFLVRCEDTLQVATGASAPPTVVLRAVGPTAAPSTPGWPPPSQTWEPMNPWPPSPPAPSSDARPLPEAARLPGGEVDIGY